MRVRKWRPFSIDWKKTILAVPELPAFSHSQGHSLQIRCAPKIARCPQFPESDDGEILPTKFGFPMRIRMPTKLGAWRCRTAMWREGGSHIGASSA
jgi:hypothetical protein